MAFSSGRTSISLEELLKKVSEANIAARYLDITEVPCVISSPVRRDIHPSLGIHSPDGKKIRYTDYATGERGGLFDLLSKMWHVSYDGVLDRIEKDFDHFKSDTSIKVTEGDCSKIIIREKVHSKIEFKKRDWKQYDIDYWESYGISKEWLEYARVVPISHKIIIKNGIRYIFGADKYAYAYIETKEDNVSVKIYQPFNKNGFKWCTSTDSSVISLWTQVPEEGDEICICSSLKDALCLWSNTGIPAIATQGEGYTMSDTAINELKRRFKVVYVLFDNDEAGLIDGEKLCKQTGFTNVVLPKFEGGKDVSDLYHTLQDRKLFREKILTYIEGLN